MGYNDFVKSKSSKILWIFVYMRALGKDRPLSVNTGQAAAYMRSVDGPLLPWGHNDSEAPSPRYRLFSFSFFVNTLP